MAEPAAEQDRSPEYDQGSEATRDLTPQPEHGLPPVPEKAKSRWRRRIAVLAAAVLLLATAATLAGGWKATDDIFVHAARTNGPDTPSDYGLAFENVRLVSGDGTQLAGWWIPAQDCGDPCVARGTVVAAAGYTSNKSRMLKFANLLARGRHNAFLIDLRGQGESEGHTTLGAREPEDMLAAIFAARERSAPGTKIGLFGRSMGAATALQAAVAGEQVAAVAEDSGFASQGELLRVEIPRQSGMPGEPSVTVSFLMTRLRLGFDPDKVRPVDAAARLQAALLVMHGGADDLVPVNDAYRIYDAAQGPKEIWVLPEAGHTNADEDAPAEYNARLLGFFDRYLAPTEAGRAAA